MIKSGARHSGWPSRMRRSKVTTCVSPPQITGQVYQLSASGACEKEKTQKWPPNERRFFNALQRPREGESR